MASTPSSILVKLPDTVGDTAREIVAAQSSHAELHLLELVQTPFAGPHVLGSLTMRSIGAARRACKTLHSVPLETYLGRVLELSGLRITELQRILARRVCGRAAWPQIVRRSVLPHVILRVPRVDLGPGLLEAAKNGHAEVVDLLLAADATVDSKNINGYTPLHWAAHNGHTACVRSLLAANATVDRQNRSGYTPVPSLRSYQRPHFVHDNATRG